MEIKFKFKERNFSISIGHETPWFSQLPFVTFSEEFYDDPNFPRKISFAKMIWHSAYSV